MRYWQQNKRLINGLKAGGKLKIIIAVVIFSAVILIHELGHFLLAKKNKIEVIDIEYCEKDKIEYQKTIKELLNKYALVENQEQDEFKGEVVKIHISIGKKKKIRIGDIVGALSNIDGLENSDLGVIKIYDNYSTVDILNQKGKKFLNDYKEIIVKNKKAKIREEK